MRMTTNPSFAPGKTLEHGPVDLKEGLQVYFSILFVVSMLSFAFHVFPLW